MQRFLTSKLKSVFFLFECFIFRESPDMMVGYSSFNVWVLSLQSFHVVSFNGGSQYVVKKGTSMVVPQPTAFGFAGKKHKPVHIAVPHLLTFRVVTLQYV